MLIYNSEKKHDCVWQSASQSHLKIGLFLLNLIGYVINSMLYFTKRLLDSSYQQNIFRCQDFFSTSICHALYDFYQRQMAGVLNYPEEIIKLLNIT